MIQAARAVPDEDRIEDQKREIIDLINQGGDVNATDGNGKAVLQYAIDASRTAWDEEEPNFADIVSILISRGAVVTNDIVAYAELDHALNAPPPIRDILRAHLGAGVSRKRKGRGKKTLRTRRSTRRRTIKHKRK